jgi:hypothetical protein
MNLRRERRSEREEYLASLTVDSTKDALGAEKHFVADMYATWIQGPFDSKDGAWAWIARVQAAQQI